MKDNRNIYKECPLCGKSHELELITRISRARIKDEDVEYEEYYYVCPDSPEDENEFVDGKTHNMNMLNARNAYRVKMGLMTSEEIVKMREDYNMSQVDLAKALGWGEATISRYESNLIQYEAYDSVLRMVRLNAYLTYGFLKKNKGKFSEEKYADISNAIVSEVKDNGREYLRRQVLQSEYIDYEEESEWNGYSTLNIDKIECVISYFASKIENLHKIKLMKLIWYTDMLNYKLYGKSMTGLVYRHHSMGALPIGHDEIVELDNVLVDKIEEYELTRYNFYPNDKLDMTILDVNDVRILDKVICKFESFSTRDIVEYMHKENAYMETENMELISYSYGNTVEI